MNDRTLRTEQNHFAATLAEPGNGLREVVYRYALTLTPNATEAEELTQEALYRALKADRGCDPRRSPEPWLRAIVRNAYIDRLRQRHSLRLQSLDAAHQDFGSNYEPPEARDPGPLAELLAEESASQVNETLGGLRPAHRQALRLRHIRGLTYEQIAAATRTPVGTIRSRLARATEAFRRAYREQLPAE